MWVPEKVSPFIHPFFQIYELLRILQVFGQILHLMGIFLQIEEKLMVNLRIDMELPFTIIYASLVVLKGEEKCSSDPFGISPDDCS